MNSNLYKTILKVIYVSRFSSNLILDFPFRSIANSSSVTFCWLSNYDTTKCLNSQDVELVRTSQKINDSGYPFLADIILHA